MDDLMMDTSDHLYGLLPSVYRLRDEEQGYPLRALLRVIGEQVGVVERDLNQVRDNWFIETAEDWVVPYIADLIGYEPVHDAGEPGDVSTLRAQARNNVLIPRREVGNTLRYRRRKGTLALLEELAEAVAGWPSRAVEFYRRLLWTQQVNHVHSQRGRLVDVRQWAALEQLGTPFEQLAHSVDVRRPGSHRTPGRFDIPSVGLFVWRLRTYSVTRTPAACLDESPHCFTFSVVGNDTALHNRPQPEQDPTDIARDVNLPTPIRRRLLEAHLDRYYGEGKSIEIWLGEPRKPVPEDHIIAADLRDWQYRPKRGYVAVDPERGRLAFSPSHPPGNQIVWVSYRYAFSADMGGGEYTRPIQRPSRYTLYQVGEGATFAHINDAIDRWRKDQATLPASEALAHAVIEIVDSGLYEEQFNIVLNDGETLQISAAQARRPVIGLSDSKRAFLDALSVSGRPGSRFTLDGLLVVGRSIQVAGTDVVLEAEGGQTEAAAVKPPTKPPTPVTEPPCGGDPKDRPFHVVIRHCTLVPGWGLDCECEPSQPGKPSLELRNMRVQLTVQHSILGAIQVVQDEVARDPVPIRLSDSIIDATSVDREALDAPGCPVAHAVLTAVRCTIIGLVKTHAIALAENSILLGKVLVARRQEGCVRFCWVAPRSRTPRRYHCQPDLVESAAAQAVRAAALESGSLPPSDDDIRAAGKRERERIRPRFNSLRYGHASYGQLASTCSGEVSAGADDESEMGAFHDLYQPQRVANLRVRLTEFSPAGTDAGIIFAS